MPDWPELRLTLRPFPWTWRLGWWRDAGMTATWILDLGPLSVEWWA